MRQRFRTVSAVWAFIPLAFFWVSAASSHEVIDTGLAERHAVQVDALSARIDGEGGTKERAEAAMALGRLFGDIANLLSLDRGSHGGEHSLPAKLLLDALRDRGLAPVLSPTNFRYEPELWPFERYLEIHADGADAAEARYRLLRASFEKTVVPNPFGVESLDPDDARALANRAVLLHTHHPDYGDAGRREEIAFMASVFLWRAHFSAAEASPRADASVVRDALQRFAADYPSSLRLGAIEVMHTRLETLP